MRSLFFIILIVIICINKCSNSQYENGALDDNEFAEFEEFDENEDIRSVVTNDKENTQEQDSIMADSFSKKTDDVEIADVSEEDDDEQFEFVTKENEKEETSKPSGKKEELKFTQIPAHLRANWESYYMEFVIMGTLALYLFNYFVGRTRNWSIASQWLDLNRDLLESNFSLVGDDGKKVIENPGLIRESDNIFIHWCSGRQNIDGMITEIALLKRQDLVSSLIYFFKPSVDKIIFKLFLNSDVTDNFVFCLSSKKTAIRLAKEVNDISMFCPEKKNPEKYGISENLVLMNEIGEAANFIFDSKFTSIINKNLDLIDYLHISDQFCGLKSADESTLSRLSETKRIFFLSLNVTSKLLSNPEEFERLKTMLQSVFYLVDRLKRFKLNRESKLKSEKNRQKLEKIVMQQTHLARQEMAQQKREEKRRQEKEKIMNEEDPEKQRKMEEKEYKRELKKKVPKMKSLKVKSM